MFAYTSIIVTQETLETAFPSLMTIKVPMVQGKNLVTLQKGKRESRVWSLVLLYLMHSLTNKNLPSNIKSKTSYG